MKTYWAWVLVGTICAILVREVSSRVPAADAFIPQDALVRKSGCLECHSIETKVVGPAFQDIAARYKNDNDARRQLSNTLKNGGKGNWTQFTGGSPMPPFSRRLSDSEIAQLVDWVLTRSKQQLSVDAVPNGAKLFETHGCLECHGVDKKVIGPSLQQINARYRSDATAKKSLVDKIRNGGKGNWTAITYDAPMPPFRGRLTDDEINRLVDWVLGL